MASGLIYLIILGMWGAYFLPRWLTHHDASTGRATERYKSAMKVVASTPNIPEPIDPDKRKITLRIRRVIFGTLFIAFAATSGAVITGVVTTSILLIPTTAFAIYLINVRRQVVAAQLKVRRLRALQTITTTEIKLDPTVRISLGHEIPESSPEHWIPLAERHDTAGITVIPKDRAATQGGWSPVAVPKPTYATAPKAFTPKRIIDLTIPGHWTAEQERQQVLEVASRDELFDQELAEQAAQSRDIASNE
jgi:hypothetical protein